jgi:predicted aspartyl protease
MGPVVSSPPDSSSKTADAHGKDESAAKDAGSGAVRSGSDVTNRLTTPVLINGQGPYHFLVDTGAERTLLADDLAVRLALPRGDRVMVEGIIRGEATDLVNIESLQMGRLVCPRLEVPVLPRSMLNVDGYLGLDVLDQRRVVLDFTARTITVAQPQGFFSSLWEQRNEAVVHTMGSSGRLRATNCFVNGVRASAFIDTGAEVSIMNPALYKALQRRAARRQVVHGQVGIYGVTGGSMTGLDTNVDRIQLGELNLTYMTLVVARLDVFDIWGLREEPALLFGMDCLRRFARVSIDYRRKELRFELANNRVPQILEAALPPPLAG